MKFRKKGMIDVGELHRQGKISTVDREFNIESDKDGFVDVSANASSGVGNRFYRDEDDSRNSVNSSNNGYGKKEVDDRIQKLDSMIYKLEQRVELLERKAGVDNGTMPAISW